MCLLSASPSQLGEKCIWLSEYLFNCPIFCFSDLTENVHSIDKSKKTLNKRIKKTNPSGKDWNKNSRGGSGKRHRSRKKEFSKRFWQKTVAMDKSYCISSRRFCICSMFGDAVFQSEKRLHHIRGMKPIFSPFPQRKSRPAHERFTVIGWQTTFDP